MAKSVKLWSSVQIEGPRATVADQIPSSVRMELIFISTVPDA